MALKNNFLLTLFLRFYIFIQPFGLNIIFFAYLECWHPKLSELPFVFLSCFFLSSSFLRLPTCAIKYLFCLLKMLRLLFSYLLYSFSSPSCICLRFSLPFSNLLSPNINLPLLSSLFPTHAFKSTSARGRTFVMAFTLTTFPPSFYTTPHFQTIVYNFTVLNAI